MRKRSLARWMEGWDWVMEECIISCSTQGRINLTDWLTEYFCLPELLWNISQVNNKLQPLNNSTLTFQLHSILRKRLILTFSITMKAFPNVINLSICTFLHFPSYADWWLITPWTPTTKQTNKEGSLMTLHKRKVLKRWRFVNSAWGLMISWQLVNFNTTNTRTAWASSSQNTLNLMKIDCI